MAILFLHVISQQTRLYLCCCEKVILEETQLSSNKGLNIYLLTLQHFIWYSWKTDSFCWEYLVVSPVVYITNRFILILWQKHFLFIQQQLANYMEYKSRFHSTKEPSTGPDSRELIFFLTFTKIYDSSYTIHYKTNWPYLQGK